MLRFSNSLTYRLLTWIGLWKLATAALILSVIYVNVAQENSHDLRVRAQDTVQALERLITYYAHSDRPPYTPQVLSQMVDVRSVGVYCGNPLYVYAASRAELQGLPASEVLPRSQYMDIQAFADGKSFRRSFGQGGMHIELGLTQRGEEKCVIQLVLNKNMAVTTNHEFFMNTMLMIGVIMLLSLLIDYQMLEKSVLTRLDGLRHKIVYRMGEDPTRPSRARGDEIAQVERSLDEMIAKEETTQRIAANMASHLEGVLDTVLDGIITIDINGRITSFNLAAEQMFGYNKYEVIGQNVSLLMPEPYHGNHDSYLSNYFDGGPAKIIGKGREVEGRRKDGSVFPIELGISEMSLSGERHFVGCIHDITERRRSQENMDALVANLTHSNAELERFAYLASHDLQEPLRMVVNFNSLLQKRYGDKLDERAHEYIRISVDAGGRMRDMIRDLLDYARVGNEAEQKASFSARTELEHVLENLRDAIEERQAVVTSDELPEISGNPIHFMRLMQNLIGNALKYQQEGQRARVHIAVRKEGAEWVFSVHDNGIGIKAEYLDQIFQPFKRLHNTSYYKGTGIGLAICRRIIENWGGRIWVESNYGEGSTFFFAIPE